MVSKLSILPLPSPPTGNLIMQLQRGANKRAVWSEPPQKNLRHQMSYRHTENGTLCKCGYTNARSSSCNVVLEWLVNITTQKVLGFFIIESLCSIWLFFPSRFASWVLMSNWCSRQHLEWWMGLDQPRQVCLCCLLLTDREQVTQPRVLTFLVWRMGVISHLPKVVCGSRNIFKK